MASILHIKASDRGDRSYSLRLADAFLAAYADEHRKDKIRTLDLAERRMPEFDALAIAGKYLLLENSPVPATATEAVAWKAVERTIEDFKTADKFVISSPMWNFGIPYRLKQFFDVIVQPGYTFSYSAEKGYTGLVTGKPIMLCLARGGEYKAGTAAAAYDFQLPYLKGILGFIGFAQIDSIVVEPTLQMGREVAVQKLGAAITVAREKAKSF